MVFSVKGYLCTTELLKIYHNWGMKITNLQFALEYQRGYPMKKFVEKVTANRIQATLDKDTIKQNLWKLVANSSYGRLGKYPYSLRV